MGPTECGYCKCDKFIADSVSMARFLCGSTYWPRDDMWQISDRCAHKCAVQLVELRERVQTAIGVLDDITSDAWEERSRDAFEILRGNSSKSSNSSPITTDDLATADYYEAVRQRVPWIVTIQHIEGLVEGYRQCGLMVWEVVEHIQRVCGGKHGQAD